MPINYPNLITAIDAEISRLQQVRNLLAEAKGTGTTRPHGKRGGKRTLSAEARAKIAAAQKRRWAQQKRASKK